MIKEKRFVFGIAFAVIFFTMIFSCKNEVEVGREENETFLQYPELEVTNLPTVVIDTARVEIADRENWIKGNVCIENGKNYNLATTDLKIKGRGNTTWTASPKKSYSLKLAEKKSVLGFPKHKRWVLIANYLDNSFIKNSMAFFLSEWFGMEYTVHGDFVNLVLNGEYQGLYWLGEAIKVDSSRVDIDENDDFLLEIDAHYDEVWKFRSELKNLPYNIKNDDSMSSERLNYIVEKINALESYLFTPYFPYADDTENKIDYSYIDRIDIDSFAKYYLVQEIMCNLDYFLDLEVPSYYSVYVAYDISKEILKAGPVWDFDASFLSYVNKNTIHGTKSIYNEALFKIPQFKKKVSELMSKNDLLIQACQNKVLELYEKLKIAQQMDAVRWNDETYELDGINFHKDRSGLYTAYGYTEFSDYVNFVNDWLKKRIELVAETYSSEQLGD